MNKTEASMKILQSAAKFQHNIAAIVEAKAEEAERSRHWICNHLREDKHENHAELVREIISIHFHILEVIDGLTHMENALAKNLRVLMEEAEEPAFGMAEEDPFQTNG